MLLPLQLLHIHNKNILDQQLTTHLSRTRRNVDTKKTPVHRVSFSPNININNDNDNNDDISPPTIHRGDNSFLQMQYNSTPSDNSNSTTITQSQDPVDMDTTNDGDNDNDNNNNDINSSGMVGASHDNDNTNNKQQKNNKKKKANQFASQKVVLDNNFLQYIRRDTFDSNSFKKGEKPMYSQEEINSYEEQYSKQLSYNFSQRRAANKKNDTARASRSASEIDLDSNLAAYNVTTSDFRELSRYVLEDMLKCTEGDKFVVLLPKDTKQDGTKNIPKLVSKQQIEDGIGGEVVTITKRKYYCLKARISAASMNGQVRLGMTRGQFERQFNNRAGGFVLSFDGTEHKMNIAWKDMQSMR